MMLRTLEVKVDALLAILDDDIRHVEATISHLDRLRALLIKREDRALEQLLGELPEHEQAQARTEQRRQALRRELADELGYGAQRLTLSALQRALSGPRRAAVADRQTQLKSRLGQLKREYTLTHALVAECARFNRSLMRVFFGADADRKATYGATGVVQHQTGAGLVSLHL